MGGVAVLGERPGLDRGAGARHERVARPLHPDQDVIRAVRPAPRSAARHRPTGRTGTCASKSHPFHEGSRLCGRREVSWLPGRPHAPSQPARGGPVDATLIEPLAFGIPGHSGGSAPVSHRLPCPPTLDVSGGMLPSEPRHDRQSDPHLHAPRRRRRDAPRRHEPGAQDAPADRGLRHRRRAQRADRRRAHDARPARAPRRVAAADPERPLRRRRRHLGPRGRRARAPARAARADRLARGGLRRGQRRPAAAEVLRAARRHARRRLTCTSAAPSAGARSGA